MELKKKYMVYVNPYVGPEYYSGGWIIKLRESDGSSDDSWDYTLDSILRRAALKNGIYPTMKEAKKALDWAKRQEIIIFSKIMEFTQEEINDLVAGENKVENVIIF
ncbi:MAG: hypothetical protein KH106_03485 [Lactococcus lactis]|nr:hypothetical protein [Lactococcus lactis]